MASSRCVVQNCSNHGDNIAGISMHYCALSAPERPKWFGLCIYIARISTQKESFLSVLHTLPLTVFRELFIFRANREESYPVLSQQSGRQRRPMKVSLHVPEER